MRQTALFSYVILLFLLQAPLIASAQNLPLDSYLEEVSKNSEELQAVELDIQALKMEIKARDLELSPILAAELNKFWDDRPSSSFNPKTSGRNVELTFTKPFSTGTSFNLSSGIETTEQGNSTDEENILNWQLGFSQSLWQNSFGRQTSYRRERDQAELRNRLFALLQERQDLLIEFETLYWDLAYTLQELKIREEDLTRSKRMLEWVQNRVDRLAAERVDLLQAQALVSTRELQLQLARDNFETLRADLYEKVVISEDFVPSFDALSEERELSSLVVEGEFATTTPTLIETLRSQAEADELKAQAKYDNDQLKSTLEVGYAYGRRGLNTSFSTARHQVFSDGNDYHQVGVVFSVPLDFYLTGQSRKASELKAKAQQLRSVGAARQSTVSWEDLERTINEQKARLATAVAISKIQQEKSQEERARYEKGKTTAFQAISFEQEAAESELLVWQLTAQLRRTEAQARSYVQKNGTFK